MQIFDVCRLYRLNPQGYSPYDLLDLELGCPTVLNTSIRGFNTDTDTGSQYCSFDVFICQ
jgi:hypothetical protein